MCANGIAQKIILMSWDGGCLGTVAGLGDPSWSRDFAAGGRRASPSQVSGTARVEEMPERIPRKRSLARKSCDREDPLTTLTQYSGTVLSEISVVS